MSSRVRLPLLAAAIIGAATTTLTTPTPAPALAQEARGQAAPRAAHTTTIRPARLDRGAGPGIPRQVGHRIVDGDVDVRVPGQEIQLLGKSGDEYVVVRWLRHGRGHVERVAADGSRTVLLDRVVGDPRLSRDGRRLFETVTRTQSHTVVTVRSATTGVRQLRRSFPGFATVLDADRGRAIVGAWGPDRTVRWKLGKNRTKRITRTAGYFADIRADRLATFTADPYEHGCSVLTPLSAPHHRVWRSCRQLVLSASPHARRLLTTSIIMDGPLGLVSVHRGHGRFVHSYRAPRMFGPGAWEDDRSVLLTTHGSKKAAVVRCTGGSCERASRLVATGR